MTLQRINGGGSHHPLNYKTGFTRNLTPPQGGFAAWFCLRGPQRWNVCHCGRRGDHQCCPDPDKCVLPTSDIGSSSFSRRSTYRQPLPPSRANGCRSLPPAPPGVPPSRQRHPCRLPPVMCCRPLSARVLRRQVLGGRPIPPAPHPPTSLTRGAPVPKLHTVGK